MGKLKLRCEFRKIKHSKTVNGFGITVGYGEVCDQKVVEKQYGMYLCQYHIDFIDDLKWFLANQEKFQTIFDKWDKETKEMKEKDGK